MMIRLVTFDALHTLVTPTKPIHVQYSEVFAPYLGVLSPSALKSSFKASLRQVQRDKPAYHGQLGAHGWWSEVIKRTAIGAGADPQAVELSLNKIVSQLMDRFSSRQGYKLFDDAFPVRLVLADLGVCPFLRPLVLSEEEGIEKPDANIFRRTFRQALDGTGCFDQGVHVGDELECDYLGAQGAGMQALLIRRPGPDGEQESKKADEDLGNTRVISSLYDVVDWVRSRNAA